MKLSYKTILDPSKFVFFVFSVQLFFWWLFFPDKPTVIDGNARYYGIISYAIYFILMFSFILGGIFGKSAAISAPKSFYVSEATLFKWGKFCLILAIVSFLIKFNQLLLNPNLFYGLLNSGGINRLARSLNDTQTGVGFLSVFWVFSTAAFSYLYFNSNLLNKYVKKYFYLTFVLVMLYSIFNMTRTAFITYFMINFCCYFLSRKVKVSIQLIAIILLFLMVFYWLNALLRTGVLYSEEHSISLFSIDVQVKLFQEFVEKYLAGELNNAFIVMSHDAEPFKNFAYGSIFQPFTNAYALDGYFLNTQNIFGIWYWQFGVLGAFFITFCFSFIWRFSFFLSLKENKQGIVSIWYLHYLFVFPGLYSITRINYFFLLYYLIPVTILFFMLIKNRRC